MASPQEALQEAKATNVTKTVHRELYPAISPSRPELNQAGRVVLITGGGTGIGKSIARSFVCAGAATVIIIGRRADVLTAAATELQADAKKAGTSTNIIARPCDLSVTADTEALWQYFAANNIVVDVLVLNALKTVEPKPLLELGTQEIWSQMDVNVRVSLDFAEKLSAQPENSKKFILYVGTNAMHSMANSIVAQRPAYSFSKLTTGMMLQFIAQSVSSEKLQIISFHPGVVFTDIWAAAGLDPEKVGLDVNEFDHENLSGGFAVWCTTEEASFLHGRFAWASWDVNEMINGPVKKRILEDPYYLCVSVVGLRDGFNA